MLTKGIIIGNIIDNLATLQGQIALRGRVHLYDLNTFCENFFRDVLNLSYDLKLVNLNEHHSNEPGIDLGDLEKKVAFQITSEKTSEKINKMLRAITDEQLARYPSIKLFLIGDRQSSYTGIDATLKAKFGFELDKNIIDISDLTKKIVALPYETLHEIHLLFEKQFHKIIFEFQIPDKDGSYPDSLLEKLEITPDSLCKNAHKFFVSYTGYELDAIVEAFNKLAKLPRVTRQFLIAVIKTGVQDGENYKIGVAKFRRLLPISEKTFYEEILILSDERLVFDPDEEDPYIKTRFDGTLFDLTEYALANNCLEKLLSALDFTILDD